MHFYFCARSGQNTVLCSHFQNLRNFSRSIIHIQLMSRSLCSMPRFFLSVEINVCGVWDQQALSKRIPFKIDLSKVAIFLCRTIPFYRKTYGRWPYVIAKFFQGGGYRTKMKIWSENFSCASGAQKKGFPNFSPAAGFFRRGGTENR